MGKDHLLWAIQKDYRPNSYIYTYGALYILEFSDNILD